MQLHFYRTVSLAFTLSVFELPVVSISYTHYDGASSISVPVPPQSTVRACVSRSFVPRANADTDDTDSSGVDGSGGGDGSGSDSGDDRMLEDVRVRVSLVGNTLAQRDAHWLLLNAQLTPIPAPTLELDDDKEQPLETSIVVAIPHDSLSSCSSSSNGVENLNFGPFFIQVVDARRTYTATARSYVTAYIRTLHLLTRCYAHSSEH
jgi:hypothetical protein